MGIHEKWQQEYVVTVTVKVTQKAACNLERKDGTLT